MCPVELKRSQLMQTHQPFLQSAEIARLSAGFNLVKVHPLMPHDEPERVTALFELGFNAVITDATDNPPVY